MPTYTVDPQRFHAEGAVVNWDVTARRLGISVTTTALAAEQRYGSALELRWILRSDCGLPTEPFVVWTRPHSNQQIFQTLTFSVQQLLFAALAQQVTWTNGPMSTISITVNAPSGGSVFAYAGSPMIGNIVAYQTLASGTSTVELSGKLITSLLVSAGVTVTAVRGVAPGAYANAAGWTAVELVGIPVTAAAWSGIGKHGEPQGLTGSFTDAPTAAIARLKRGAPPFGWGPNIAAGIPAPPWTAPDFNLLVKEVNTELLNYLHDVAKNFAPADQAAQTVTVPLPPPQNSMGQFTNKPGSTTQLKPLPMTFMAAATDPFLSLVLGFGTAYGNAQGTLAAANPIPDFMITAHWEKGLDGKSAPADFAAIIPAPTLAPPPPAPTNLVTQVIGALRPLSVDGDWRESVRVAWDRPVATQFFRTVSSAAARVSTSPAAAAIPLMETRTSGGYRPIAMNAPLDPPEPLDPEWWRMNVMDREIDIPSSPGTRQMKYGAAVQDLYGQWSVWTAADCAIAQPDLDPVRMGTPKLLPVAPASGSVCATTVEFDFFWDWRVRSPKQIQFTARMYAAATHGDPPPVTTVPSGFARSLGGGGGAITVTFAGNTPSTPDGTIIPLTEDGEHQAASFGAAQGTNRRYRLSVTTLSLDFASTPFIGLAIWAQGQEAIAPNRSTAWPPNPLIVSTGDPRPPVVPVQHVLLGSIPDAAGSSHVQISWTAQPNATGYFVYEATETNLLEAWGLPQPAQKATLDARLLVLKNRFKNNPLRRPFTRWNAKAIAATSADIALPRGSTAIHLYVVLGVSAGQVESLWPAAGSADNALIAIAAPHITKPAPPMIEVQQFLDTAVTPPAYKARLIVTTRPGPRPGLVEVYRVRVDDAATELDTMGPPIARLQSTTGPWTVATTPDPDYGPYIQTVTGVDAPSGSWRRVWYRATAWTNLDQTRGGLPGRSEASTAAWVVLPPAAGPSLSALAIGVGPTPPDIILEWTCASPLKRTPLGPHLISVRATVAGSTAAALISLDTTLDALGKTQPATGSGIWIVSTSAGVTTYRALIRRAAITDVVNFAVRITDPLGRTGAQLMTIAAGSPDPPPDLSNLHMQKIALPAPARIVLTFSSSSPLKAPLDGPYMLKVTGVPTVPVLIPPPPSVTVALGSVPTKAPLPAPAFYMIRSIAGPPYTYTVVTTANLKGFVVRITGPDGKFVEKSV